MAVFGLGYSGFRRPLETIVVIPPAVRPVDRRRRLPGLAGGGLHISAVVPDEAAAEAGSRRRQHRRRRRRAGRRRRPSSRPASSRSSASQVNTVDPVQANYAVFLAGEPRERGQPAIIEQGRDRGRGPGRRRPAQPDAAKIPPDVVAAPTKAELDNIAPSEPQVLAYFGPAVLALILQHLAVTLIALSLVRERTSGVIELFRVAPVNAWEVIAGKVVAYVLFGGADRGRDRRPARRRVPGPDARRSGRRWRPRSGSSLLASLGLGLLIAVVSDSERQAVQLSLLLLLASVFFSGFVLAISEFTEPVRVLAYMLPVTHGIRLIQDIMLRGAVTQRLGVRRPWRRSPLVTLFVAWRGLRRGMSRA